jgi:hypothetical protein
MLAVVVYQTELEIDVGTELETEPESELRT